MVKLASVVVAGLAFCVLANDSDKVGREISRKSVGNVGNGWFGRVLNRRAYDKSQGLGGDGEKFNDKAVSHLRGGKKKSPAPMSRAKIFRIKMLNFLHTLSNSALESVPHITKLLASPVGRDLSICFSNKDPSELASKIGLWVLKTIPMSAALAPFENIRVARDQAGGDVFLGVKQMWQRDGVLGFWRNLWLLAAQNFGRSPTALPHYTFTYIHATSFNQP
uniref:Uncharacterized protein n=1 Tax=Amorphochlora amoebiformis TaxID=1561963 RepID=A0A7S0DH21_9EUKA|mmetsp:Transcript_27612/g.43830  ORF Transcript_27612/g.43830 Transcript_27612/m.43830 type:complete len:221 (+) Transcript_27612:45-707(+)